MDDFQEEVGASPFPLFLFTWAKKGSWEWGMRVGNSFLHSFKSRASTHSAGLS